MKKILLPLFVLGLFTFSGCDDHDHGDVTITFLHPADDEKIPMSQASNVEIHIKFEWDGSEGEEVKVKLHPEGNHDNKIIDFKLHQHNKVYEFKEEVNLSSFAAGTKFHLEAKGCEDHDCNKYREASIHFELVE